MRLMPVKLLRPVRYFGPAIFLLLGASLGVTTFTPSTHAATESDHTTMVAAIADLHAAIREILNANDSYVTDRNFYHRASQRAINALEGVDGPEYRAAAGSPGDSQGALGHLDALLHRKGTPVWAAPLDSAEANMRAAVAHLLDANKARELMDYALASSRALAYLEVARGRPNEVGVFGGLEGTMANTVLGVPEGATVEDGCHDPTHAPAYGVHGGYIAWVAIPASEGVHVLAESPGETSLKVVNGMIVLPTAAANLVATDCRKRAEATPGSVPTRMAATGALSHADPPGATSAMPAIYTEQQAAAGRAVFAANCVACHGSNLQGTAAPSVAGTDFLKTAHQNGWTVEALQYLVLNQMPFNAPHSLSPKAYASVIAFLLASNCYPAGNKAFPTEDEPAFAHIDIAPVPGPHPGVNNFGVCPVG